MADRHLEQVRPDQATLVPVRAGEVTSEAGWSASTDGAEMRRIVGELQRAGVRVSLFVDARADAVEWAAAMGAEVTVLSTSESKREAALALGATHFGATRDPDTFKQLAGRFDLVIDTVSGQHDYNAYLSLLKFDGSMVLLGIPAEPVPVAAGALIMRRRKLGGSLIGGIRETQEMLDFCAAHGVASDIELIDIVDINQAYERMLRGDVRYRFVIDCASLG